MEERFQHGKTLFKLPFMRVDDDPLFNKAAFMGLWAEMIWFPAVYATHPGLRWEAVDETSARLWFPSTEGEDSLLFSFDPASGLPDEVYGLRNPNGKPELIGWRNRTLRWQTMAGMQVPAGAETIWENEGYAWAVWSTEAVALNVDVSARLP